MSLRLIWFLTLFPFLFQVSVSSAYENEELLQNRLDPNVEYKTIETPHFQIHYSMDNESTAFETSQIAERVHAKFKKELGFEPRSKTNLVITENSDRTNAMAIIYPDAQIFFNPVLPSFAQEISSFSTWLEWLITHEYTHIFHTDYSSGFYEPFRFLGGSWVRPNLTYPKWILEGLGVYMETNFTNRGRGDSAVFWMMMKMPALEQVERGTAPPDLNEFLLGEPEKWPWALNQYLYGYHMVKEAACLLN
jgi:hypothetical protein